MTLLALVAFLFAQVAGESGYVLPNASNPFDLVLATARGRFDLSVAYDCTAVIGPAPAEVEVLAGSGGVVQLRPWGSDTDQLCNAFLAGVVSDDPCSTDDAGFCDVSRDPLGGGS